MSLKEIYTLFLKHPNVTTDTRNCIQGSIFIALKGDHFNGNRFAQQAIESGCSYAFVDEEEYADGTRILFSGMNGLELLQSLAKHHRRQFRIPVIGVTGTNGKTTTKELVASVLLQGHKVLYTHGNLNNHIGVPLTLLQLTAQHSIAVIEMGANHPGEIATLCSIAEPTFGLITNVGKAHLEGFGSFEGVVHTKGELYAYLLEHDGVIFMNGDNPHLTSLVPLYDTIHYGKGEENIVIGGVESCNPFLSYHWKVKGSKYTYNVQTHLIGEYNLENILAATIIGRHFGITPAQINKAISNYVPTNNRSQFKKSEHNVILVDAYNANPSSMSVALENIRNFDATAKVIILGDMLELGEQTIEEHQSIATLADECGAELVLLVGPCFGNTTSQAQHFATTDALREWLHGQQLTDKTILLKGSRGMKMEQLLSEL